MQAHLHAPVDPRLYSPNRDLAHCFDQIILETANRIEAGRWDYLQDFRKREGVTDEQLGAVCQSLAVFALSQLDYPRESMNACLARSGFLEQPAAARAVVMAYLGTVTLGVAWAGVHEATLSGEGPLLSYARLRQAGRQCVRLMRMGRFRRRCWMLYRRLRRAWLAVRYEETFQQTPRQAAFREEGVQLSRQTAGRSNGPRPKTPRGPRALPTRPPVSPPPPPPPPLPVVDIGPGA